MIRRTERFSAVGILLWTFHTLSLVLIALSLYQNSGIPPVLAIAHPFLLIGLQYWHIRMLRKRQLRATADDPLLRPGALSSGLLPPSVSHTFSNN